MVPDGNKTCLGMEYFCFEHDGLWAMDDEALIELAFRELIALQLVDRSDVEGGVVVRMPKAYPMYDGTYQAAVKTLHEYMATLANAQVVGRNGMHRYNNQDHSMVTALMAAKNVLGAAHDPWSVNLEQAYQEQAAEGEEEAVLYRNLSTTQPHVPARIDQGTGYPYQEDA
jgi:hypothetical protein